MNLGHSFKRQPSQSTKLVVAVAEWLAKHSRGVNFAGGEIGTSRSGSLYRSVGVITYVGAPYD